MTVEEVTEYQANNADDIVSELFTGQLTVVAAIERLRTRLLDLTARNRLLNYRHPKGRSLQIAGEPNINLVFDRLYADGKNVLFKYIPEPPVDSYEGKRPDEKQYAAKLGISTSYEFTPNLQGTEGQRLSGIQTLLYPPTLERRLRKLASEARMATEETGTNMLFLIFGFLEFYDSEDSERPMLAPLLSLPVTLLRGDIDQETRTYQYTVQHNGEDLAENQTLKEKLRRDFMLSLPEFNEEDSPGTYFQNIEHAFRTKRRWKVRRQITLGMLSFGKLIIWSDLNTAKNPGLLDHHLIMSVFSGGTNHGDGGLYAEDYRIDELPDASQSLIYDADSSQHSAIIDVLSGKNLVVNGPPGTGKSQTITNIIAAAMVKGQKVLFVSEKMAALEVVRRRLNQAGLGYFCLELHSHKTQKKRILEDVKARLDQKFSDPPLFYDRLATLQRQKNELAQYASLMGSCVGNALGLTVNEIFWAVERRRQELSELAVGINAIHLPAASTWTLDDLTYRNSKLANLVDLFETVGEFGASHPWWGFKPNPLAPSDDELIARIVRTALDYSIASDRAAFDVVSYFGLQGQPDVESADQVRIRLDEVPKITEKVEPFYLSTMFDPVSDPDGRNSHRFLLEISSRITEARKLLESASRVLVEETHPASENMAAVRSKAVDGHFAPSFLATEIEEAFAKIARLEKSRTSFASTANFALPPSRSTENQVCVSFLENCKKLSQFGIDSYAIESVSAKAHAVYDIARNLSEALANITAIAQKHSIPLDTTPGTITALQNPTSFPGLKGAVPINAEIIEKAQRLATFPLANRSVFMLDQLRVQLHAQSSAIIKALSECKSVMEGVGLTFDSTDSAIKEAVVIANVAATAPVELLEYRISTFGHASTEDLLGKVRRILDEVRSNKADLEDIFYLDALPAVEEIKASITALRRNVGILAFMNGEWRNAKRCYYGLCKEKRKISARMRVEELVKLLSWIETREAFVSNEEFCKCFGRLFCGLETDPDKIARLNKWYLTGRNMMAECPGLLDKIDLSAIPAEKISEVAAKAQSIQSMAQFLASTEGEIRNILGINIAGFREARAKSWEQGIEFLNKVIKFIGTVSGFFALHADKNISPKDAVNAMEAYAEFNKATPKIILLLEGEMAVKEAAGEELAKVAALVVGSRWAESLPVLSSVISLIVETSKQAMSFVSHQESFAAAKSFAMAKNELDNACSAVLFSESPSCFADWAGLLDKVRCATETAKETLMILSPCAKPGVSIQQVITALAEKEEAGKIIERIDQSGETHRILSDRFDGIKTDLDCLLQTHSWGEMVYRLNLPIAIRKKLLTDDAQVVLDTARQLYSGIDNGYREFRKRLEELTSFGSFCWDEWQGNYRSIVGHDLPSEIKERMEVAVSSTDAVLPWARYLSTRLQCRQQEGLSEFVSALENWQIPSKALTFAFTFAAYQSIGRQIYREYPTLSQFNGSAHDKLRSDYRALDAEIVALTGRNTAVRIYRQTQVPEGQRGATVGEYTDLHLLNREINKKRRHIPIRQLLKRAGRALQELKPCFMMGPLSVAQYLEQGTLKFDLVVMDEASQLRPEEALGAIVRGSQVVVVGDPKQLPPTNFFDRMVDAGDEEEEDETPAALSGMESILDICQHLFTPVRSLRWHYRSQHESLIAFSNHHFYKNLIVFPSPYAKCTQLGVKYRYVRNGLYKNRQNMPEAQRVVEGILEHMLKRPDESLGVVTLNQSQRELIEELLANKLRDFQEGAYFMSHWEEIGWPFFVKNLENVQGDERDVIFISTTFGKVPDTDKVRQNFGPISRPDGWRRLNVLFTRSKRRIELFTSMEPEDIVVSDKTPLGTKALRDYLDFAKRGVLVTTDEDEREPDSDFEISVAKVIRGMGYEVKPQLGVAGFFIDMVVRNPDRPGEFLAAIECDGATYHSGFSVRDRDRIRQEILESLGWKDRIHRIWSTDWFYEPHRETERLKKFLEDRRRCSAAENSSDRDDEEEFTLDEDQFDIDEDIDELAEEVSASNYDEDLFVEVGDKVIYCFVDNPDDKHSVMIVDTPSNPRLGLINEETPLAMVLLGLAPGEEGQLEVRGKQPRKIQVLKVQRQKELFY